MIRFHRMLPSRQSCDRRLGLRLCLLFIAQILYRNRVSACLRDKPCKNGLKAWTMNLDAIKEQYNYSSRYDVFSGKFMAALPTINISSSLSISKKKAAMTSPESACGKRFLDISGIIDGDNAPQKSWPWQVIVYFAKNKVCGGVLIDKRWVLTAAHCIKSPRLINIGKFNLSRREDGIQSLKAVKQIVHENYGLRGGRPFNDIGLMKLHRPVLFTTTVFPACLPTSAQGDFHNAEVCYISGFGATKTYDNPNNLMFGSSTLQELKVKIVPFSSCAWNYRSMEINISSADICFKPYRLSNAGPCKGDSGGPLSCRMNGTFYVAGIASFVFTGCYRQAPFAYVRVSSYNNWILNVIKNN